MSPLLTASIALVSTLKDIREHNPDLRFLNLEEIEAAIELEKKNPAMDSSGDCDFREPALERR